MSLEQIIELFESIERGEGGQVIGFHLHKPIGIASEMNWRTNQNYSEKFSGFLKALKNEPPYEPL